MVVAQWSRCCATNLKVAGSIPVGVSGFFHWHNILPIALWFWGRLSLKQKWVPGAFPRGKGGWCVRLTTLPSCAVVTKSGNLNFLEPSGPLQACNGPTLPFSLADCVYTCNHLIALISRQFRENSRSRSHILLYLLHGAMSLLRS